MDTPPELDALAEAIWRASDIRNRDLDWAKQPDAVKYLPWNQAQAAVRTLMQPSSAMIKAGAKEQWSGGTLVDQWIAMLTVLLGTDRLSQKNGRRNT